MYVEDIQKFMLYIFNILFLNVTELNKIQVKSVFSLEKTRQINREHL